MKLTKEQIESMHTLLVRERPMGTSVAAVDELCRLALLGLERDERQAVTSEQAAKDIKILEQIHAKSWDEAVALRHAAEALSERDERAERIGRAVIESGFNVSDADAVRTIYSWAGNGASRIVECMSAIADALKEAGDDE